MQLIFLTPLAALVGLAALVPLAAALLRERRDRRVRGALRLRAPAPLGGHATALAGVALVALLAAAAAQPALRVTKEHSVRTDAEALFVFDVSRSMLARRRPRAETRFARAIALGLRLRHAVADVPAGVVSLSDRPLLHLFPTADADVFAAVVARAIAVGDPPPALQTLQATDLSTTAQLASYRYFSPTARRRLIILLTDGESVAFTPQTVRNAFERGRVNLLLVRVWSARERIYGRNGRREPHYHPDATIAPTLARLAALTGGQRVYGEHEAGAIVRRARLLLGSGPAAERAGTERMTALAPWLAGAALLPLLALLVRSR